MLSYWEQQHFTSYHFIVIGSGIVGLSTALCLRDKFPHKRILVLERGLLPTGASTRNAGFACMGSATEILDDLQTHSEEEVLALFKKRMEGLQMLRNRLGDEAIGFEKNGSYELLDATNAGAMEHLPYLNALLQPLLGFDAYQPAKPKIKSFGFNDKRVLNLIENRTEGSIDTGKMMRSLLALCRSKDIEIWTGARVTSFFEEEKSAVVLLEDGHRNQQLKVCCEALFICTNAFTLQLLPDEDVVPGRGQVLITKPIPNLPFQGTFHLDKGYYYFRTINNRVLIGGGRNLDFEGEQTTEFLLSKLIQDDLEEKLRNTILPDHPMEVDLRWAGIMAFGKSKGPIVKSISSRIFGAFRMGGMGVALGSKVAEDVVALHEQQLP